MKYRVLIAILCFAQTSFAQYKVVDNINLEPYFGENEVGVQINPVLTGLKGTVLNQEMDLNIALFYQEKYTIKDTEVIGLLQGRLISETPLSSFDILAKIREDNSLEIANYGIKYEAYQDALENYQNYQNVVNGEVEIDNNSEDYYYYEDGEYPEYEEYPEYPEENTVGFLNKRDQRVVAQSIKKISTNSSEFLPFPSLQYTNTDPNSKTLSAQELEFLIRFERLKKTYNEAVKQYNLVMSNDAQIYKESFDPADPTEEFTIMLMGENNYTWSKKFQLDGKQNYQSHDNTVWYLGYQLELTKKDLIALYYVFENNEIEYIVKGTAGKIDFKLSNFFISAVKNLLDLYTSGKFVIDSSTIDSPIMSN